MKPSRTAFHEAGHAIAAKRVYGGGRVRAVLHPDSGGRTDFDWPSGLPTRLEAAKQITTVLLAAGAAELLADGVDPMATRATPRQVAEGILRKEFRLPYERGPRAPRPAAGWHGSGGDVDCFEWLAGTFASAFGDEGLALRALDATLPGLLQKACRLLKERPGELQRLAERLERERDITI